MNKKKNIADNASGLYVRAVWKEKIGLTTKNKFTVWSGQRAIKRDLWFRVPKFYKKGFRIELGLNFFAYNWSYKKFPYKQYLKENKYGLLWGFYRRSFMMFHIFLAYLRFPVNYLMKKHETK